MIGASAVERSTKLNMWLEHRDTGARGWHIAQIANVPTLLVFVATGPNVWHVEHWDLEACRCVTDDRAGPL